MADQSDVETALVETIAAALYPDGPAQPSTVGGEARVYRGWPQSAALEADLAAGRVNVTIYPVSGTQRNKTRFPDSWTTVLPVPGLSVSAEGDTVTFTGSPQTTATVGLIANSVAYSYQTIAGDTERSVAAAVAALVRADRPAFLLDSSLRVPGVYRLVGNVVGMVRSTYEVRRQVQRFRVTLWCPTPELRDVIAALLDMTMASTPFLGLPDGSAARLVIVGSETSDQSADACLYRRDFLVDAEYATTVSNVLPRMLFGDLHYDNFERLV